MEGLLIVLMLEGDSLWIEIELNVKNWDLDEW